VSCDTHRVHYSELTIKGVYHHRPETVAAAVERLASGSPPYRSLIQAEYPLDEVGIALRRMAAREILKAAIVP
jgi:L-iditol 2-dehydrogenase